MKVLISILFLFLTACSLYQSDDSQCLQDNCKNLATTQLNQYKLAQHHCTLSNHPKINSSSDSTPFADLEHFHVIKINRTLSFLFIPKNLSTTTCKFNYNLDQSIEDFIAESSSAAHSYIQTLRPNLRLKW